MKKMRLNILLPALALMAAATPVAAAPTDLSGVRADNVDIHRRGDKLTLALDLVLDDLKLGSNEEITYRPIVVTPTDTTLFSPAVIYGRNQEIKLQRNPSWATPGALVSERRYNGTEQRIVLRDTIAWQPWMEESTVMLAEDLCGCGDLKAQDMIPLADLDYRPAPEPMVCYITPQAERVKDRDESGQAFLDFIVNKTDIVPTYRNNQVEIQKIINTINLVKDDPFVTITNIDIHGYASPEGSLSNNTRLALGRSAALKEYVKSLYDLPDRIFTSDATPEDWEGFKRMLNKSDLAERDAILDIIATVDDLDKRDHEIRRRFPQAYAVILRDWYPALRHSDYKVSYVVRPLTVDEAKQVLKTNPKNLSLNEMFLVAQTYEPGTPEFNEVFDIALRIFPDDPTANLNAACVAINSGNLERADQLLLRAGDTPEAIHARGLVELKRNNFAAARVLLEKALELGVEESRGNIEILNRNERLSKYIY